MDGELSQIELEEIAFLKQRLISARKSGLSNKSPEEMLAEFKEELRREGKL